MKEDEINQQDNLTKIQGFFSSDVHNKGNFFDNNTNSGFIPEFSIVKEDALNSSPLTSRANINYLVAENKMLADKIAHYVSPLRLHAQVNSMEFLNF